MAPPLSQKNPITVQLKLTKSTDTCSDYSLEFTNICFKLVGQLKFHVQVPKTSKLANHWGIVPLATDNGTADQQQLFTLPNNVHLYPGQSFASAGISVNGADRPEIVILDVQSVLCTEKPDDAAAN
ncbi:hypothetical protein niasHT_022930 [Heterodera trifolii]|uniref:Uncharacterized protein n=1 Tax=Heterodera trifolii TaxID=157864 RepID=A0ABD2KFT5_9BILA